MSPERERWRWYFLAGVAAAVAVVFVVLGGFDPALRKDERFYWPAAQLFSREWIPSVQTMRESPVLTTPLSMLIWGWLERLTGQGLILGRLLNAAVAVATVGIIALDRRASPGRAILAGVGLLACPYFIGVATHLYSDPIAVLLVVAGTCLYTRGRWALASLAFAGAVATRQYTVAFPAAVAGYEFLRWVRESRRDRAAARRSIAWIAPSLAAGSILAWIAMLGGLAPAGSSAEHHVSTASLFHVIPRNALYHLACVGAYFVGIELVLDRGRLVRSVRPRVAAACVAVIAAGFVAFPPIENYGYAIPTMGHLDKALRAVMGDVPRLVMLGLLASLAAARFSSWSLAAAMVVCSAAIMTKAHFAWDKFALPLLGALWTLSSGVREDGSKSEAAAPPRA